MRTTRVVIPTLHAGQVRAYKVFRKNRFVAIRAGRRWGKTELDKTILCDATIKGSTTGWFAPDYKRLTEAYHEIAEILRPVKQSSSRVEGVIRTRTGGRMDFWTLEDEHAGRSRRYHIAAIDEAAFTKPNMMDIWERAIKPTLLDFNGKCLVTSNTNGIDATNFLWRICNQPEHGFAQYHAPTSDNPLIPFPLPGEPPEAYAARRAQMLDDLRTQNHPLVYQQEYLAEFVDWSGVAFFSRDKLLVNGEPVPLPTRCEAVYAVVDTATKTGKANDGTGVIYFAILARGAEKRLVVLDWDLVQIEGALLETWLPVVFQNLEALAKETGARMGALGTWIEDKSSGMVLLQHAVKKGWKAHAIDSKLTAVGKDERAISVSGYVYRELVKLSARAFDKVTSYKGATRNQLLTQVIGFRIGDKDTNREDDLLDAWCYAIAIALGNQEGY